MKFQIRSKQTRWRATFKTLADAKNAIQVDWAFRDDPTVYIVQIEEKVVFKT